MALTPSDVKAVFASYQRLLGTHREALNRLNVYPVPDGDTGSNMAQTVDRVIAQLDGANTMDEVASALADGALHGAAGNSGVILAQALRGIADMLRGREAVGARDLAAGLAAASSGAYRVVTRPVEGTILTVVREAAAAADGATKTDLAAMLEAVYTRAVDALARTPDLMPRLKDAGVVDAGAAGFLLFLAALVEVVTGSSPPLPDELLSAVPLLDDTAIPLGPRYEVMFFLETSTDDLDEFRSTWDDLGDSIVVVGGDGLWNCHVHTDDIGAAIEAGIAAGRPRGVRVTDLHEQVGELEGDVAAGGFSPLAEVLASPIGVVAVVNGPGLLERFRLLGVQEVVAGGQSANPTVGEVRAAVESAPADTVVILPNNKNIVPVAEQVDALTTKTVAVVPTRSVVQGLAAMLGYVPDATHLDALLDDMAAAAGAVEFGEVTMAVRDARVDGLEVAEGDWIGLADGRVVVAEADRFAVLRGLVAEILPTTAELLTVYTGVGASLSDTKALEAWVGETHPDVEIIVIAGGQPVYPYLVAVE